MADSEVKAVIVLDDGNLFQVQSTVAEVGSEIETRKNLNLPLIPVVDHRGREVWLNANHIVSFYEAEPPSPS
jgi:uncharacterized protein YlzI (FlbEa/FlbD family)